MWLLLLLAIPVITLADTGGHGLKAEATKVTNSRFAGVSKDHRGARFIGFARFDRFQREEKPGEIILTSPPIELGIPADEIVVSWNADLPGGAVLRAEARAIYPDHETKLYNLGMWSDDRAGPRESLNGQRDVDGDVKTDTLVLARPAERIQIRISLAYVSDLRCLKLVGISALDSKAKPPDQPPNRTAWGKILKVPERSQLGSWSEKGWCSPTSTSMVLSYWAARLHRPEMDFKLPDLAARVFDKTYNGCGNWPFNTAIAGEFAGMRGYVTRFTDIAELEDWIAAGIPVVVSVSYRLLHGKGKSDDHVAVCVGFTRNGEPVINDPWADLTKGDRVQQVCTRENLKKAWAVSKNTVYLIYPESKRPPKDRFGHW